MRLQEISCGQHYADWLCLNLPSQRSKARRSCGVLGEPCEERACGPVWLRRPFSDWCKGKSTGNPHQNRGSPQFDRHTHTHTHTAIDPFAMQTKAKFQGLSERFSLSPARENRGACAATSTAAALGHANLAAARGGEDWTSFQNRGFMRGDKR